MAKLNYSIRLVKPTDLEVVSKIEAQAFGMSLKQTQKEMIGRIENYPDTFLVAEINSQLVGHIFGPAFNRRYIADEIYFKNHPNYQADPYQMILSLAVAPKFQKQGIATNLVKRLEQIAKQQKRQAISLTCLPTLIEFYERLGFKNEGKTSADIPDPDDLTSFNMVKEL